MADKKGKRVKSAKKDVADQLIKAAFARARAHGWRQLTLYQLSQDTGLSMSEILAAFPTKGMLLKGYVQRVDHRAWDDYEAGEDDSTRDRIFDLMMCRFDELNEDKPAIAAIAKQACTDPETLCVSGCGLRRSMHAVLEKADVRVSGIRGMLRVQALGLIFLATFRTWLQDTSEDMSKTMAELDKHLARAESFEQDFGGAARKAAA